MRKLRMIDDCCALVRHVTVVSFSRTVAELKDKNSRNNFAFFARNDAQMPAPQPQTRGTMRHLHDDEQLLAA